jgi:hypothetical protein
MENPGTRTAIGLGLFLTFASQALAQDPQPVSNITGQAPRGKSRIEVGLAFAQIIGTSTFSSSQTIREYAEDGTLNGSYEVGGAPGGAFDLQYNLSEKFGVRLGAEAFSRKSTGTFDAKVPHPFFFSRPRSIRGTQADLDFKEAAFSLTGVLRGGSGKWSLNLEGGPAYFSVEATVAEKLSYNDVYPYDTLAFGGVVSTKKKVSPFGFAVGLEIGRELTSAVSVVAQGRFTQGSGDIDVNGASINIKAGGAQARIGVRIVLARKRVGR